MKAKYALLSLALGVVLLLFWFAHQRPEVQQVPNQFSGSQQSVKEINENEDRRIPVASDERSSPSRSELQETEPGYELEPAHLTSKPSIGGTNDVNRPFRIQKRENKLHIVNANGDDVIELGSNPHFNPISSKCIASPTEKRVLVSYGSDAAFDVIDPAKGEKFTLPIQPPGEHKLGFASWHWVDDDTLLGESGDELVDRKPGVEGEENNVAQTRLYLYHVGRQTLEEAKLPKGLGAKVFAVTEVSPDGSVHLVHDDPSGTRPSDLGWFKVRGK